MRTAPPGFSFMACAICLKFLDDSVIARAYLFCHLPTLPLVCFSAPLPRRGRIDPRPRSQSALPGGKGGIYSFLMQGASPLASPRLSRKRHGLNLRDKYPEGARPLCCLLTLPVACFLAPSPRPPSPPGKGEIFSFLMQGASPLASPRLSRKRHGLNLRDKCPEGACPLGRLPTLPLALLLPPSPDPLPCGKGETISLFCRGLRPLHPGVWTGRGTGSASIGDTRRGARVLVAGSPVTATPGGVGQTKRGP